VIALKQSKENLFCYVNVTDPKHPIAVTVSAYRNMLKTGDTGETVAPTVDRTVDGAPIPELEKTGDSQYPM